MNDNVDDDDMWESGKGSDDNDNVNDVNDNDNVDDNDLWESGTD